jgi:hypothetical protein
VDIGADRSREVVAAVGWQHRGMAQPSDRPRPTSNPHRWVIALAIALAVALLVLVLALVGLLLWGRLAFEYYDRDDQSGPDRVHQSMSERVASEATPLDAAVMMVGA